jgi:hypothetical protein
MEKHNMKKAIKLVKTNFAGHHDKIISKGESIVFEGWLAAGIECYDKFGGNASAYAASAVSLRWTGKNTLTQNETTIRLYVGAVVRLMKKHKSKSALLSAYDDAYESREISALLALSKGSGQRTKSVKRSSNAVALTKRGARSAWDKAKSFDEFWELVSE